MNITNLSIHELQDLRQRIDDILGQKIIDAVREVVIKKASDSKNVNYEYQGHQFIAKPVAYQGRYRLFKIVPGKILGTTKTGPAVIEEFDGDSYQLRKYIRFNITKLI